MNNTDGHCTILDRNLFPEKLETILEQDRTVFLAILWVRIESIRECKLSKEEETELLSSGWDQFLQHFTLPCEGLRLGWREFWVIIEEDDREKIVTAFKDLFAIWDASSMPNLWHVRFTNLHASESRNLDTIRDFEWGAVKTVEYSTRNPREKLFEVHVDSKSHTVIL